MPAANTQGGHWGPAGWRPLPAAARSSAPLPGRTCFRPSGTKTTVTGCKAKLRPSTLPSCQPLQAGLIHWTGRGRWDSGAGDLQVKWDVMKRKEVPKKVKLMPRAPLVLIWDTMRVVTVELSTSEWGRTQRADVGRRPGRPRPPRPPGSARALRAHARPPTEAWPVGSADQAAHLSRTRRGPGG